MIYQLTYVTLDVFSVLAPFMVFTEVVLVNLSLFVENYFRTSFKYRYYPTALKETQPHFESTVNDLFSASALVTAPYLNKLMVLDNFY